jgi:polar amino acid transport system permease protein
MTWDHFLFIGKGLLLTLPLLGGGLAIGLVLGAILAICRYNQWGRWIIDRYVSVLRGTPLLLQLAIFYYAIPRYIGVAPDILVAGLLAFGLNSSAYLSEILRSGIEGLPRGQFEAAQTLRLSRIPLWKDILLPQVVRAVGPAMVNEVISLLKETALISTLGGMDIMRRSQWVAAEQFDFFGPLCMAGIYYYGLTLFIETIGKRINRSC